jgi:hypothetical protein
MSSQEMNMEQLQKRVNNVEHILFENNSSLTCSAIVMTSFENKMTDLTTRMLMMERRLDTMKNEYNEMVIRSAKVMEALNYRILELEANQTLTKPKRKRKSKATIQ